MAKAHIAAKVCVCDPRGRATIPSPFGSWEKRSAGPIARRELMLTARRFSHNPERSIMPTETV